METIEQLLEAPRRELDNAVMLLEQAREELTGLKQSYAQRPDTQVFRKIEAAEFTLREREAASEAFSKLYDQAVERARQSGLGQAIEAARPERWLAAARADVVEFADAMAAAYAAYAKLTSHIQNWQRAIDKRDAIADSLKIVRRHLPRVNAIAIDSFASRLTHELLSLAGQSVSLHPRYAGSKPDRAEDVMPEIEAEVSSILEERTGGQNAA